MSNYNFNFNEKQKLIGLTLREVPEMNSHAKFKQSNNKLNAPVLWHS